MSGGAPDVATGPALSIAPPDTCVRFAAIGEHGRAGRNEEEVATLVRGWQPDFIITTGDNHYPRGGAETIAANVGQYYRRVHCTVPGSLRARCGVEPAPEPLGSSPAPAPSSTSTVRRRTAPDCAAPGGAAVDEKVS